MPQIPKELSDRIEANLARANEMLADMDRMIEAQKRLIDLCKRDDPLVTSIPARRSTDQTIDALSDLIEDSELVEYDD